MIITLINLVIALTLLNVWIFRFNNETKYRGGAAKSMKEEFLVYGLPLWFMYLIGSLKIILATFLIIGSVFYATGNPKLVWISPINLYCYYILSTLMLGSILMHIKVKDPIIKSLPAFSILTLLATLIGITF